MIKTIKSLFFLSLLLFIGACSQDSSNTIVVENKNEDIVILHMNDIHADINNFPKIAAYINKLRETNENVFLLSAGDLFSGNPVVDQHNKPGYPMIDLMNKLKFDASAIGNHEFDYGQDVLNKRINQANFPFICANIEAENAILNQPEPYITLETQLGFQIIILGLIETGTQIGDRYIPSTHPDKLDGIDFPYYRYEIKDYTNLKKSNNLFLVLSHLGEGSDQKLADENSIIDIIMGGHSHKIIQTPYKRNNALICQAGSKGRYIGRVDIKIEDGLVVSKSAKLIEVNNLNETDEEIALLTNQYNNNPVLERVIAQNLAEFRNKDELGSLMTDAINWNLNTDISFQNSGGIRSWLPLGDIKIKHVYELDPFNNEIIIFEMTCDEIRSLINNSGKGDLKVAGMHYQYIEEGNIQLENYDGNLIDETKTYKVGVSSYIASAYIFDHNDEGQNSFISSSECLIKFLEYKKVINYSGVKRIFGTN
ncbi:bifunctional metallophosphatase/5'-nucleotidase [Ancylomarina euxinus]|uniref:Bifunctional metallophosphatase/5'-nucleotidase n=1 Tax=Ancylomarina euxinus TaxID=2283627 RepID=A0A425Y296_9BACT|nr:bifunctional UDP-sugar hydrolase/5'-nucleotidase [Ancylomarina euxinus]MCZ4694908.1 bifunctional UDP-sugar hydrolase/5'-nucleotidase [Ancylomarina euxinus]MUP14774.1 bifunctional metallophosphatase/5'-nucleotidase [Ancylomarina euxinus]RRG22120.1 bifunctional metallophosphatase/5'-nucleotidase [Ancylomarina euxinus]